MQNSDNSKNDGKSDESNKIPNHSSDGQCPLCHNTINNRALTNTCLHEFCFQCLTESSNHNNKCPLCRKIFSSILCSDGSAGYRKMPITSGQYPVLNIIIARLGNVYYMLITNQFYISQIRLNLTKTLHQIPNEDSLRNSIHTLQTLVQEINSNIASINEIIRNTALIIQSPDIHRSTTEINNIVNQFSIRLTDCVQRLVTERVSILQNIEELNTISARNPNEDSIRNSIQTLQTSVQEINSIIDLINDLILNIGSYLNQNNNPIHPLEKTDNQSNTTTNAFNQNNEHIVVSGHRTVPTLTHIIRDQLQTNKDNETVHLFNRQSSPEVLHPISAKGVTPPPPPVSVVENEKISHDLDETDSLDSVVLSNPDIEKKDHNKDN